MSEQKCEAGCVVFDGGEKKHHPDCVHYPESRTKMYDDALVRIKELEAENRRMLNESTDIIHDQGAKIIVLKEAMQKIISFHNTHSEVEPEDYMAVVGPVIEQSKSILEGK